MPFLIALHTNVRGQIIRYLQSKFVECLTMTIATGSVLTEVGPLRRSALWETGHLGSGEPPPRLDYRNDIAQWYGWIHRKKCVFSAVFLVAGRGMDRQ